MVYLSEPRYMLHALSVIVGMTWLEPDGGTLSVVIATTSIVVVAVVARWDVVAGARHLHIAVDVGITVAHGADGRTRSTRPLVVVAARSARGTRRPASATTAGRRASVVSVVAVVATGTRRSRRAAVSTGR